MAERAHYTCAHFLIDSLIASDSRMNTFPETFPTLETLSRQIISVGKHLYANGWTPATSSNFSMRIDDQHCAITVSGKHKGRLDVDDIMVVDLSGRALDDRKPSAETLLHTQLYQWQDDISAVLHTHSPAATVLSMMTHSTEISFSGYELQKAFAGIDTHETSVNIPIFDNSQNIPELAANVALWLTSKPTCPAYLIRGHGLYTWGRDMPECERHLEALEFLLQCELLTRTLK